MTTEPSTAIVKSSSAIVKTTAETLAKRIGLIVPTFVRYAVAVKSPYSGPNPVWDDYYCKTFSESHMLPPAKD